MRKKLTAVLPAAAMFAYALAGTTGIAVFRLIMVQPSWQFVLIW